MRSLGQTTRGAVGGVKETVNEYKGWLILAFLGYLLWKFNGFFTGLGDSAKAAADAALAEGKARAEAAAEAAKVRGVASSDKAKLSVLAPAATDSQVAMYRADAETIAAALGTTKGVWSRQWLLPDAGTAFNTVKTKYSRLLLSGNKPYDVTTKKTQTSETKTSAKRKINASVLQPFYAEVTGGRNLAADMKDACSASKYQPVLKWIL